ncbi:type I restriction endonuclease subunit R [Candidatus Nitrosacidococcus sp. I8]|uniref:type I restriction endonuclease subunit R n=1 Tax=Candidatus Nitrosacidococcus sp. I8 TaxID=2942908 RepID=UPI0022270AC1|nr:type I restriction endonuclease subunit R [Candidatus Nitrosacidococcus sp. I8]CAH9016986.1 Type I restriction enzyme EcoR124II R protein [Candidatus Nitrosacidococcus sp. I8]
MNTYKTIAESKHFIILEKYQKLARVSEAYQSEYHLENELIQDLKNQGYEYLSDITTPEQLLANVRVQIQNLNQIQFTDKEWERFVSEYLNRPNDTLVEKTRKIHEDYIYDFVFDDGHIQNIYLLDKKQITRNKVQVIRQFIQTGSYTNRYDVTILINGLPLVQVELKKRGVALREALNQIHRYRNESLNGENSLFKYLQIFVISNGTDTRYFANTTQRDKNSYDFTMHWATADNSLIKDLKDFTGTFFEKNVLLNVLIRYCVFDVNNTLLIMRPYQIAATERILWKIKSAYEGKYWHSSQGGGYIWHTTGSGKTLTSFKVARLATELDFIDKVFFVVDRKDLDYQTMKEYQRFSPDSVNGSENTAGLKRNLERDDNKIIVTTIQKLNNLMKAEKDLPIYQRHVVFIFDEAHRSRFGEAQKNLRRKFKKYYQFGFTGTPIFPENALGAETTESVFGHRLHAYVITDAIRDEKVLKFKVDYNDVRPKFKAIEQEQDEKKLSGAENKEALLHPERIKEISRYILNNFQQKTHRLNARGKGFNALFAVSSVDAAKSYYETLYQLQKEHARPLKIATIFSFAPNESQDAIGDIVDEGFEPTAMKRSAKEFLGSAIDDYNKLFKTNYGVESTEFQNYYRDLAKRVKDQEIDLLIVVGMFLTGFDAPTLNTLFVDKNLRYHGLIQAYSRTNRIYDATKTFGNIITFRDLEQSTIDAITLFGDNHTQTDEITIEKDKKEFVKLFGECLRVDNVLQSYDSFAALQDLQNLDLTNQAAVKEFKAQYYLSDDDLAQMRAVKMPSNRMIQDYRSIYHDIRDWLHREKSSQDQAKSTIDWDDVVFEVELLKSQEINLDYILELLFNYYQKTQNKSTLTEEARRLIRTSIGHRAKEDLLIDFINQTNLETISDKAGIIEAFFSFAQAEQKREAEILIDFEGLTIDAAKHYLNASLKRGYASENGTELNEILPKISPLNPQYLAKKQSVFQKITEFVEKFRGIGGRV